LPGGDAGKARDSIGLSGATRLTFEPLDNSRFPAVALCFRALRAGGTFPAVLSAANEEAGRAFLQGKVKFTEISALVENALDRHAGGPTTPATLDAIAAADTWARSWTRAEIGRRAAAPVE
jgi:1-deoxy-D-xylulose-5-phosphate reductoisomerase